MPNLSDNSHEFPVIIPADDAITSFRDQYFFLSNMYPVSIVFEGTRYASSEHAYATQKTLRPDDREYINYDWIERRPTRPEESKRRSRNVPLREDWEEIKLTVMEAVLWVKFSNPQLRNLLLQTGEVDLIEGNTWRDRFWGMYQGRGYNHLGHILMRIRAELRSA